MASKVGVPPLKGQVSENLSILKVNLRSKRDVLVPPYGLERAAVVWAILERISGFDPSLEMIAPSNFSTSTSL